MRMAQDATPGVRSHVWFTPTKEGEWDIICGQLCGPGHSGMKATLQVIPAKDFDAFMKENSEAEVKKLEAAVKSSDAKK
jgi:cytochrome c oxidase subunit 2